MTLLRRRGCVVALLAAAAFKSDAQLPGSGTTLTPGSLAAERARLAEITRDSTIAVIGSEPRKTNVVRPDLRLTWNSTIPFSMNDGAMWAGVGPSLSLTAGVRTRRSVRGTGVALTLAPLVTYSRNLPFQITPDTVVGRSSFASPFHHAPASADLPLRFGDQRTLRFEPGSTSLIISAGRFAFGATSEDEVWGPGIRNQLVLSANAPGIPRLFVRTAQPWRTRFGDVSARFVAGALLESLYFDRDPDNDARSLSGMLVELRPSIDSTLTVGLERVVLAPAGPFGIGMLSHSFDVLWRWEFIATPGDTMTNGRPNQHADQLFGLFARWVFPTSGFEVYGEFVREELPRAPAKLLLAPHHTLGYTLGFQWAQARRGRDYLRLQAEVTDLEQNDVLPGRFVPDFYTGRVTPQGFTNRGQVIGAAIGPGASSQWLALDWIAPRWQLGSYVGRFRWENDAMYRQPFPTYLMHDVTVLTGIRGARRTRWSDVSFDAVLGYRYNYLFQNGTPNPGGFAFRTVDVTNGTLSVAITPR